jgi:hypothetical protein
VSLNPLFGIGECKDFLLIARLQKLYMLLAQLELRGKI